MSVIVYGTLSVVIAVIVVGIILVMYEVMVVPGTRDHVSFPLKSIRHEERSEGIANS